MLESAYFWRHGDWPIHNIPDPKDPDPIRYAVLASLVEELVDAFNFKIELGLRRGVELHEVDHLALAQQQNRPLETCPAWALRVPALEQQVNFGQEGIGSRPAFTRRNILADVNQLRNV
ncbi:hypothetical protein FRC09_011598 [Ceratobasidium sp. 395]|nr:hypothetical protein FRC09_011598 [Ceratobasidium sp. 395]